MLDIKFVRENPDAVKENIKKKFQDAKLPLVDEVIEKDAQYRAALKEVEALKAARNKLSKANGPLFGQLKKCTDEAQKAELQAYRYMGRIRRSLLPQRRNVPIPGRCTG